jgi:hypothetical protein
MELARRLEVLQDKAATGVIEPLRKLNGIVGAPLSRRSVMTFTS